MAFVRGDVDRPTFVLKLRPGGHDTCTGKGDGTDGLACLQSVDAVFRGAALKVVALSSTRKALPEHKGDVAVKPVGNAGDNSRHDGGERPAHHLLSYAALRICLNSPDDLRERRSFKRHFHSQTFWNRA